jgi:DNA repair protein RadA/Sms
MFSLRSLSGARRMAKAQRRYVCQVCGSVSTKWQGQCVDCGEWNTMVEESGGGVVTPFAAKHDLRSGGRSIALSALDADVALPPRLATGIAEFDRALGGGLVAGSATLIGGDPGIGKSTLLLQAAARMAQAGARVAYVSGEEAADQVRLRARRMGLGRRRSSSQPRHRCAISSPRSTAARRRPSSSSIRSRRCIRI